MYAQFQRAHIQKYNCYVYFIKLVKKVCPILYIYIIYFLIVVVSRIIDTDNILFI